MMLKAMAVLLVLCSVACGDTIRVGIGTALHYQDSDGKLQDVTIAHIRCPPIGGKRTRYNSDMDAAVSAFSGREITLRPYKVTAQDRRGRPFIETIGDWAEVEIGGKSLGRSLIYNGLCWCSPDCPDKKMVEYQNDAIKAKRGMWSIDGIMPWEKQELDRLDKEMDSVYSGKLDIGTSVYALIATVIKVVDDNHIVATVKGNRPVTGVFKLPHHGSFEGKEVNLGVYVATKTHKVGDSVLLYFERAKSGPAFDRYVRAVELQFGKEDADRFRKAIADVQGVEVEVAK